VFNLYGNERLTEWRRIRDEIETSDQPLEIVADLWGQAPFVNPFLDPWNPSKWPDPWKLILDGKFDDLAISLGMLYTLKLTERFMYTPCEIHKSITFDKKDSMFLLVVNNSSVLNYELRKVCDLNQLSGQFNKIWSVTQLS
jgi:hypothetical protein